VGQVMRRSPAEKQEIIHLVEHSALPVGRTLDELDVPRSSFYRRYRQYSRTGRRGLNLSHQSAGSSGTGCLSRCATRSSSWPCLSRRSPPGSWPGSSRTRRATLSQNQAYSGS
jgi:transposase-like protein